MSALKLPRRAREGGFTLVEVLTAATVALILVVAVLRIFTSLTTSTSQSDQRTDAYREARAALAIIQRDLAGLVVATNAGPYLALCDRSRGYPGPTNGDRGGEEIHFFASRRSSSSATGTGPTPTPGPDLGDVVALSYYTAWDASKGAFELRRAIRKPGDTFTALKNSYATSRNNNETPILAHVEDLYVPDKTKDDILAAYVWDLRVRVLGSNGDEIKDNATNLPYPLVWDDKNAKSASPVTIEISFKTISPTLGTRLKAIGLTPGEWMDARSANPPSGGKYERFLKPAVYEFRTTHRIGQNR